MRIISASFAIPLLATASCGKPHQGRALAVTDGCYYAGATPVLRIRAERGVFLIPGAVRDVRITSEKNDVNGVTSTMFEPGFELKTDPRLETTSQADFRDRVFLMMQPGTSVPTIMATSEPLGLVLLARGAEC
jgi:hypothetical protein